ncbi:hypothetical protein ALC57_02328 [Trachymyrmex cornetzi]|uniref:Uncharacterized protein n=1 Tax=Trachymyrmex cornetzi TaxID=471704 RepID=A0A195EK24_9HYME|nr:hypothetical protein ALC57_02328 [Trachymyrmex cornetzi]
MVVESQEERVQDNRNEIGPTVKNVGFLKVNKGRTAEESWIRRQIIVCTIEVARCDGGVKCAVITGGRGKAGKKVVNMTPIFLVVLLAIDPIIAQNTGE